MEQTLCARVEKLLSDTEIYKEILYVIAENAILDAPLSLSTFLFLVFQFTLCFYLFPCKWNIFPNEAKSMFYRDKLFEILILISLFQS